MTKNEINTPNTTQSLKNFIPKKEFVKSTDCPFTEAEFEWIFRQRAQNGFAKAFIRYNAKGYLVDLPSLLQCLDEMRGVV